MTTFKKRVYVSICIKIIDSNYDIYTAPYDIIGTFCKQIKHSTIVNNVGWKVIVDNPPYVGHYIDYSTRLFVKGNENETLEQLKHSVNTLLNNLVQQALIKLDIPADSKPNFKYEFDTHRDCFIWARHLPIGVNK